MNTLINLILLSIGDIASGILMVIVFIIVFLLIGFFIQWLSNVSGVGIRTRFGSTVATPDDWNKTKEIISDIASGIKDYSIIDAYKRVTSHKSSFKSMNYIDKLKTIVEMKEKGLLTDVEFNKIKDDIIK